MTSEREGLALVYRETQACGRVLLASDIPAAREVVVHNENGVIFPMGDVEALGADTLQLISDPARCSRINLNSQRSVAKQCLNTWALAYSEVITLVLM